MADTKHEASKDKAEPIHHTTQAQPAKAPAPTRDIERVEHTEQVKNAPVREDGGREAREAAAKDKLAAQRAEQAQAQEARGKWKPTPTQEENDLVAMGVPVTAVGHQPDGSPPDPYATRTMRPGRTDEPEDNRRTMEPAPHERGYQTR
jgi:hypothetical protein